MDDLMNLLQKHVVQPFLSATMMVEPPKVNKSTGSVAVMLNDQPLQENSIVELRTGMNIFQIQKIQNEKEVVYLGSTISKDPPPKPTMIYDKVGCSVGVVIYNDISKARQNWKDAQYGFKVGKNTVTITKQNTSLQFSVYAGELATVGQSLQQYEAKLEKQNQDKTPLYNLTPTTSMSGTNSSLANNSNHHIPQTNLHHLKTLKLSVHYSN